MTSSNPYDGLIEAGVDAAIAHVSACLEAPDKVEDWFTRNMVREIVIVGAEPALSRLTRDVEEAKEVLTSLYGLHPELRERVDATLTRLSRPTELGDANGS